MIISKNKELNPEDFKDKTPVAKIGCLFNDLSHQAGYVKSCIDGNNNTTLDIAYGIADYLGISSIKCVIDSIQHYLQSEFFTANSYDEYSGEYLNKKQRDEILSEISTRVELAKSLLDLFDNHTDLSDNMNRVELTQHKILF